ncbi:hypothetical protein HDU76_012495, partial [Blyttiomyces sp. JEL0837]
MAAATPAHPSTTSLRPSQPEPQSRLTSAFGAVTDPGLPPLQQSTTATQQSSSTRNMNILWN